MLVVEAHGVHHLVLDVAQQVGALPDVDRLADGQRVESHADTTGASPCVLKDHESLRKETGHMRIFIINTPLSRSPADPSSPPT